MVIVFIISVTLHTSQYRVDDSIMHVTLNTINDVVVFWVLDYCVP